MVTEDDGKIAVKFIATVTNIGKEEQVLFTPGVVGPVFWPRTPFKGEPLETHVAPRPEGDSSKDFVWLRPGEGFSRISDSFDEAQLRSLSSVGANLMLYEKGFEGRSDKVATVIEAKQYKIEEPTPEGKEPR